MAYIYCFSYGLSDSRIIASLSMLSTTSLEMGKTHIVWNSINNSVRDVRKAITKARMITGTYMLQTLRDGPFNLKGGGGMVF
jgi:hypothetical protein